MAHFAQVDENWIVQRVVVVNDSVLLNEIGAECDWIGERFCQELYGVHTRWIQTSYNGSKYKNFAGVGFKFDPYRNAFIPPKPYSSWVFNEKSCGWDAPKPYPQDGLLYEWSEESLSWIFAKQQPQQ